MSDVVPTGRELEALKVLWGRGKATVREIYQALRPRDGELAYTTVLSLLQTMEQKGLVARERSADDRRQVICRITAAGSTLLRRLDRPVDALDEDVMQALDDVEVRELIRLLDKVRIHNRGR